MLAVNPQEVGRFEVKYVEEIEWFNAATTLLVASVA